MSVSIVTISATYGAGGSIVGPAVAARLGLTFVDRAIPAEVARRLAVPQDEADHWDDRVDHGFGRLLGRLAPLSGVIGTGPIVPSVGDENEEVFCRQTEAVLREVAASGAVILGRAAALVLGNVPGALHVRLDGPAERRRQQAARIRSISEAAAAREQRETDAAREQYVRHFYRRAPNDQRLYHLVMDTTVIDLDAAVEMVALAAQSSCGATVDP